jgi:hypothetical protein
MQSVVSSPSDAAFSLAGVSGLPTIAPVLGVLGLQSYTLNSLFIAPLVADNMTVTFTPFNGPHMWIYHFDYAGGWHALISEFWELHSPLHNLA